MSAILHTLPGAERNARLVMVRRAAILARPDVQATYAKLERELAAWHAERAAQTSVNHADTSRLCERFSQID